MPFGTGEGGDDDSLIERSQHHRLHARRRPKTMEGYAEVDAWRAAESQHRCNFGRVAKPHAGLGRMPFAFPVKPDVKHRQALLRIGTDHRAGRPRWTLP
jgi:hypothetical protein